uniref:Carboxypeptidase Q n=1 Tax=Clastoptera arizonana TaxID=38151 RepID=A0A1B6D5B2_9HEMI
MLVTMVMYNMYPRLVLLILLNLLVFLLCAESSFLNNEVNEHDLKNKKCNLSPQIKEEILNYKHVVNKIFKTINEDFKGKTWSALSTFTDKFGNRISGTENLENAIDYMLNLSQKSGLENVHGEEVMVPHWVRGKENATLIKPRVQNIAMLGLGSSIGTPQQGITANVIVVKSFEELKNKSSLVKDKIVVYNEEYVSYGETVKYRSIGAVEAAKFGAVASLIRSITPFSINSPHTGMQSYDSNVPKIPAAAITIEDAEMMQRMQDRGEEIIISLFMEAKTLPDTKSRNTVADIRGSSNPEKVVIVSGHIDSWDVGQGAMDDGGGALISWFTPVLLKYLNLRPKRTVRAILWTAEEEGYIGAAQYYKDHINETKNFMAMMESDEGTFNPQGLEFSGTNKGGCIVQEILKLMEPINATKFKESPVVGSDISLWANKVPTLSLLNDNSKYFWFHHSNGDTMTVENADDLDKCLGLFAATSYIIADMSIDFPGLPNNSNHNNFSFI